MNEASYARLDSQLEAAFSQHPAYLRPLLDPCSASDVPWMPDVARIKRFLEWWSADSEFRDALEHDPDVAMRMGLEVDADEVRFLWDEAFHMEVLGRTQWVAPLCVQRYRMWSSEKIRFRERLRREGCAPGNPRHRAWRERQVKRTLGHLGSDAHENIIHAPFAIEISEGCSVGCWFCGVSAERKKSDFRYTDENRRLWLEVLSVLRRVVGPAAARGFLYWATDPLDNPDYEKFALDFARICGKFPQTTTAQAHKHIERVRALLKLSAEHGCEINRFSILTLSIFKRILQAFTAEELLHCELVMQNGEASAVQSNSGRARGARQLDKRAATHALDPGWREAPGTISCVSGFLINMVRRTVRLLTPCPSSDIWPNGHWVLEEGHFDDAEGLSALLEGMMERHMPITLRARDRVRLRADLEPSVTPEEIRLSSYGAVTRFANTPRMGTLLQAVAAGDRTAGEIVVDLENSLGWPAEEAMSALNGLFDQGLLDEEPRGTAVAAPPTVEMEEVAKAG